MRAVTAALWDGKDGPCDHAQASQTRHSSARSISPYESGCIDDLTTHVQHDEGFQAGYAKQSWRSSDAVATHNYPPSREGAPTPGTAVAEFVAGVSGICTFALSLGGRLTQTIRSQGSQLPQVDAEHLSADFAVSRPVGAAAATARFASGEMVQRVVGSERVGCLGVQPAQPGRR